MHKKDWWKCLFAVIVIGGAGVLFMGVQTYHDAPPVASYLTADGDLVVSKDDILNGQVVFQKYALMEYGTMFGDGGMRGPDFTAEALHQIATTMTDFYKRGVSESGSEEARKQAMDGVIGRVKREIKENRYNKETDTVTVNEAQALAFNDLVKYYTRVFKESTGKEAFKPAGYITDDTEIKQLASFFWWGAWVCGAERPGSKSSYTHNWPYDESAGNTLTSGSILWSVVGSLSIMLALGIVLYMYGKFEDVTGWQPAKDGDPVATTAVVDRMVPSATQRATYKFFAVAAVLFLLQVLAGVFTVHDFINFTVFWGFDVQKILPLPVVRSWHVQFSVLWISTAWIAGSIFCLARIAKNEPRHQLALVNLLFWLLALVVGGTLCGGLMGPMGMLGENWRLLGNQGWEFVELGKLWQWLLFMALILWAVIIYRGVRPALAELKPFSLPNWMLYVVVGIVLLFCSSFVAAPKTNFVVADFWRWMVIHMWAECFFEVFTTVVIAYYMVLMGLVGREAAARVVYFATLLFIGSGFLGISHNFYWNAKPEATLALGSVFSTMQVVPLILLTVEAWKFRQMPLAALRSAQGAEASPSSFGLVEAFLYLIAVNFWNFFGAGVFGFIINLPVVNYFEHGTYLTVNHGHAALMGVYGNLSIAAILFCSRHVIKPERWNAALLRFTFWSINLGLMLMVLLDLFPAGIYQFAAVLDGGLWSARSQGFVQDSPFQTFTWMRIIGGAIFLLGGVIPLAWFMVSRLKDIKAAAPETSSEPRKDPTLVPAAAGE